MTDFLKLIRNNYVDEALQVLRVRGEKVSNAKFTYEETSALMLAAKCKPYQKAINLIDELMRRGASIGEKDRNKQNILLFACKNGADLHVIDCILNWSIARKNELHGWWHSCDITGNGAFILAVQSENVEVVRHIAKLGSEMASDFLESKPNYIIDALHLAISKKNENLAAELIEVANEYSVKISSVQYLLYTALNDGMFSFIEKYRQAYKHDFSLLDAVWRWMRKRTFNNADTIPSVVNKIVVSYERSELWKKLSDLALVFVRRIKGDYGVLRHIASFVDTNLRDTQLLRFDDLRYDDDDSYDYDDDSYDYDDLDSENGYYDNFSDYSYGS